MRVNKKLLLIISLFFLTLIIKDAFSQEDNEIYSVGYVDSLNGYVTVSSGDDNERIRTGRTVYELDEFKVEEDSAISITFNNGCVMTAESDTEFIIEQNLLEDEEERLNSIIVTQISGVLNIDFNSDDDNTLTISTPSMAVGVRGTKFTTIVAGDGSSLIGVEEGSVTVSSISDIQTEIDEDKEDSYEDSSQNLGFNKDKIMVNKDEQLEIGIEEKPERAHIKKLANLKDKKKNFIKDKKENIIKNFPEFSKKILKRLTEIPVFIKHTEKRYTMFIKLAKRLNKEEKRLMKLSISESKKKKRLEKIKEKKVKLHHNGMEFFKDAHFHSHKIMASFKVIEGLPKILEDTEIVNTKVYKKVSEKYRDLRTMMKEYMDKFKDNIKQFKQLLKPSTKN